MKSAGILNLDFLASKTEKQILLFKPSVYGILLTAAKAEYYSWE